jgi:hypothetical protein
VLLSFRGSKLLGAAAALVGVGATALGAVKLGERSPSLSRHAYPWPLSRKWSPRGMGHAYMLSRARS